MAYTHTIKFRVGDGSDYMNADLELIDGELNYKFTGTSQPIKDDLIGDFREFANQIKTMAIKYGGIKEVSVIKKE